jgi:predicted AAA+ superfamily ATPase
MIQEILQEKIIPRKIYLDKIFEYWNISLIKVIIGMRRAGKSSILKCIIQKIVNEYKIPIKNIFFIDKEKPDFDYITDYNELKKEFSKFLGTIDENKKIIIAIDEIQEIEKWEKFVNGFLSKYKEKIEIFITGSNSTMLSSELSTLLV